jgi:hypothetical protein
MNAVRYGYYHVTARFEYTPPVPDSQIVAVGMLQEMGGINHVIGLVKNFQ